MEPDHGHPAGHFSQGDPVKVVGYADDILLMVTGPDKGTLIDIMNEALERVLTWEDRNGLTFNPLKTCAVLFTRKATRGTRHNRKLLMLSLIHI